MDNPGAKRSRAYHRYFEGYTELYDEKGKIQRAYTEDYYLYSGNRLLYKLLVLALYMAGTVSFLEAAWMNLPMNHFWLFSVLEAVTVMLAAVVGIYVAGFLFTPKKLKLREYRNATERLPGWCTALMAAELVLFVAAAVFSIATKRNGQGNLLCCFLLFLSGALTTVLRYVQKQAQFETEENPLKGKVIGSKIF